MKKVVCVAMAVIIDLPDDEAAASVPLGGDPLDELTARLRREAAHGRDCGREPVKEPEFSTWIAAAFQECAG